MSYKSTKNKSWIDGGFVAITYEIMNSKAFKSLNGSALKTLVLCMRKVKVNNPIDRFKYHFEFTYPEARKQGLVGISFCRGFRNNYKRSVLLIA